MRFILVESIDDRLDEKLFEDLDDHKYIYQARFQNDNHNDIIQVFSDDFELFLNFIHKFQKLENNKEVKYILVYALKLSNHDEDKNKFEFPSISINGKTNLHIVTDTEKDPIQYIKDSFPKYLQRTSGDNDLRKDDKVERLIDLWIDNHDSLGQKYNLNNDYVAIIK